MSKFTPNTGTLMASVKAPTEVYSVASKHGDPTRNGFLRLLPYQRSGQEVVLVAMRVGRRMAWVGGDSAEWTIVS